MIACGSSAKTASAQTYGLCSLALMKSPAPAVSTVPTISLVLKSQIVTLPSPACTVAPYSTPTASQVAPEPGWGVAPVWIRSDTFIDSTSITAIQSSVCAAR